MHFCWVKTSKTWTWDLAASFGTRLAHYPPVQENHSIRQI